jgi:hypothetical protein
MQQLRRDPIKTQSHWKKSRGWSFEESGVPQEWIKTLIIGNKKRLGKLFPKLHPIILYYQ